MDPELPLKSLQARTGKDISPAPGPDSGTSFYKDLLDHLRERVYFVNRQRVITYWSQGAAQLTGYSPAEVIGRSCVENFLEHVDEKGCCLCVHGCPLQDTIGDGQPREAEIYLRHKLGHRVPISIRATPICNDSGDIIGAVEVFSDASAKRRAERRVGKLECLAYQDPLTGVANRRYAQLKVQQEIQEVRHFRKCVGLLLIDLDDFKRVNDTWGHEAGDLVLRAVSRTLVGNLRPSDVVGRWGGEEFLIILVDANLILAGNIAERCRMLIAATSVPVGDTHVRVKASVGATLLLASDTAQSAIKRADELMYKSKTCDRNRTNFG